MDAVATVWWPPPTSLAFLRKFLPNLLSNIIWQVICWNPICRSPLLPSNDSKAGCTFFIYCKMASHHRVSLLSLLICNAYFTVFVMRILYLCVLCQYLLAVLDMIWSRFFNTCLVHQAHTSSSDILFWTAYSESWIGYDPFTSWFVSFYYMYEWIIFIDIRPIGSMINHLVE